MVSEKVIVTLGTDASQVDQKLGDLEAKADRFITEWNASFRLITSQIQSATRAISGVMGVVSALAGAMGNALDPAFQAMIITVQSATAALSAIAAAYSSAGVGTALAAIIGISIFTLNLQTTADLVAGREEVAGELQQMRSVADAVNILLSGLR